MTTTEKLIKAFHDIYPTQELLLFLIAARQDGINGVILEDLNAKIHVLQENPELQLILQKFYQTENGVSIGLDWAIDLLEAEQAIFVDSHNELTLLLPMKEQEALENAQDYQTLLAYRKMVINYRGIPIDIDKAPKVKRRNSS